MFYSLLLLRVSVDTSGADLGKMEAGGGHASVDPPLTYVNICQILSYCKYSILEKTLPHDFRTCCRIMTK